MPVKVSIGQILREGREARGLTPEQAAFQSRTPLRLLQALEADDYRVLPDPAYLIRFLHEYARLVAVDPSDLEREFREAIRRPPGTSLAVAAPPAPPPSIPWKQVLWTAVAILVITPLVFIALSLASKRAAERPGPSPVAERSVDEPMVTEGSAPVEELAPPEGDDRTLADRLLAWRAETPPPSVTATPEEARAPLPRGPEPVGPVQEPSMPSSPAADRKPRGFFLTARALELTWMAVRADGRQDRLVLLQKGETAQFTADTGFVITVGNAGGVDLSLNGEPMPALGRSGQVIRNLAIPPVRRDQDALGRAPSGTTPPRVVPGASGR